MANFLNTDKLIENIPDLIKDAKEDLLIVVPFIQLSHSMKTAFEIADKNKVQIIIICRYPDVKEKDKKFLKSLKNLNLFSHPNVHAKCYYNEKSIIITSLNLTSHSERNNREMGVQIFRCEDWDDDVEEFYEFENDLIIEIQNLLNGSEFKIRSVRTKKEGFYCSLLKTNRDRIEELCSHFNKKFSPKKFRVEDLDYVDYLLCENYFDKIDLRIKDVFERIEFEPNKGKIDKWTKKLKPLNLKSFHVELNNEKHYFKIYLNSGARLNIVGYNDDMEIDELLMLWKKVLDRLSKFFTPELLKI